MPGAGLQPAHTGGVGPDVLILKSSQEADQEADLAQAVQFASCQLSLSTTWPFCTLPGCLKHDLHLLPSCCVHVPFPVVTQ
jgi:hypothetical protein